MTGASNGGQGAFHVFAAAPEKFSGIVVLPGGFAGSARNLQKAAGKFAWLLVGANDLPWKKLAERTLKVLQEAKLDATLKVLPGQGHLIRIQPKELFDYIDAKTKPRKEKK